MQCQLSWETAGVSLCSSTARRNTNIWGLLPDLPDWGTRRVSTALLFALVSSFFLPSNVEFAKNLCLFSNKLWLPWSEGKSWASSVHSPFLTYCLCDHFPSDGQFSIFKYHWIWLTQTPLSWNSPTEFHFLSLKAFPMCAVWRVTQQTLIQSFKCKEVQRTYPVSSLQCALQKRGTSALPYCMLAPNSSSPCCLQILNVS